MQLLRDPRPGRFVRAGPRKRLRCSQGTWHCWDWKRGEVASCERCRLYGYARKMTGGTTRVDNENEVK